VTDMAIVISGDAADVELDMALFQRLERNLGAGAGVIESDGHFLSIIGEV
jgi:hypothetical protein